MVIQKYMKSRTHSPSKNLGYIICYILTALLESIKRNALMLCQPMKAMMLTLLSNMPAYLMQDYLLQKLLTVLSRLYA